LFNDYCENYVFWLAQVVFPYFVPLVNIYCLFDIKHGINLSMCHAPGETSLDITYTFMHAYLGQ